MKYSLNGSAFLAGSCPILYRVAANFSGTFSVTLPSHLIMLDFYTTKSLHQQIQRRKNINCSKSWKYLICPLSEFHYDLSTFTKLPYLCTGVLSVAVVQ